MSESDVSRQCGVRVETTRQKAKLRGVKSGVKASASAARLRRRGAGHKTGYRVTVCTDVMQRFELDTVLYEPSTYKRDTP